MTRLFKNIFSAVIVILFVCQFAWAQDKTNPQGSENMDLKDSTAIAAPETEKDENKDKQAIAEAAPASGQAEIAKANNMFLNFDNADLVEVINTIASILQWNYIIAPEVDGTVNIHTEGTISKDDLPAILDTILKINNVVKVQEDSLVHFIPLTNAKSKSDSLQVGSAPDAIESNQDFIIQVVKLNYLKTKEMMMITKNYTASTTDVFEYEKENILIISGIDSNVKKLLKIISLFDVDIFKKALVNIYPLSDAPTEEVTKELESIFNVYDYPTNTARGVGISFFAIGRINAVLAIATNPNLIYQAEKWIKKLDKSVSENKIGVFIYNVQNVKAEELANTLSTIFVDKLEEEKEFRKNVLKQKRVKEKPFEAKKTTGLTAEGSAPAAIVESADDTGEGSALEIVENKISITAYETTNSIIIKSTQRDYKVIMETIKELDVFPKQVLIEVTIAEILLDSRTQFGVEWQYSHGFGGGSTASASSSIRTGAGSIGSGLAYVITNTNKLKAALKASAQNNKVNILSSPRVIASDNQPAKIEIGEDVPLVTSSYRTNDVSSTATTVDQTIQYRSTGIILDVTPRINEAGLVQLEVVQEVSEVSEKSVVGVLSPVIYKRSASTTLAVNDGETVIIGGLMKQKKVKNNSGVPFLSKIPILGYFFSYTSESTEKTELMILITPRVIKGSEDSIRISLEYNNTVRKIREAFKKAQGKK